WRVEAPGGLHKAMKFVFGDLDAADEDSRPAEQELKALKRVQGIRHPYVLSLERYDIIDGQLMIVMELADRNLWDRFRECRGRGLPGIPRDELLSYLAEAAEALDLMNNHYQIQHLDIKPQNLFLVFNHVKVGDFGLAKLMDGIRATVTGGVTPVYAAPETFEGYVSRYSDQYSLAIVFQELLTGTRPFNGANTRQLMMQHITGNPEMAALPPADRAAVGKALSKRPDDRWPTCTDLVRALKQAGLPLAPAPPTPVNTPCGPAGDAGPSALATRVRPGDSQPPLAEPLTPPPRSVPPAPDSSTPLPPLVALGPAGQLVPRLVTQGRSGVAARPAAPAMTLARPDVFQTGRMHAHGIAPPERTGTGVLFPALVVAVGGVGRLTVEHLRRVIHDRYGTADKTPNVRYLLVDTDPAAAPEFAPDDPAGFAPREAVVARLHRPAHYLQRDGLPPVDGWMPAGALYKLSRNPGPADGVRAFGRLALVDNHKAVAARVRQEVEALTAGDALDRADAATGLGVRTNRPRVYLVAGLGGGTGGGMAVDLAYLLRHELRAAGYRKPEVHGLFLVPPADRTAPRGPALGNAHAALAEVAHFQAGQSRYQVAFDKGEAPVTDDGPPFARLGLLDLPKSIDPRGRAAVAARAARGLFQELLTPAGRARSGCGMRNAECGIEGGDRASSSNPNSAIHNPHFFTFGLYRLTWPRPEVLAAATRRLAGQTLRRWAAKDPGPVRDPVTAWLDAYWADKRLGFEAVLDTLEATAKAALGEDPDAAFDAVLHPLRTRTPGSGRFDAAAGVAVLEQLIRLVGKPTADEDDDTRGAVHPPLAAKAQELGREAEAAVALMAVGFVEKPEYRLAGAEEAVRQVGDRAKRQVDALEPVRADLDREVRTLYGRSLQVIGGLTGGGPLAAIRTAGATADALDLLRVYPRKRLQLHLLDHALALYRRLAGSAPEYLRDLGTCRAALADLEAAFAPPAPPGSKEVAVTPDPAGPGRLILPDGCQTLDDAADRFLAGLSADEVREYDAGVQREAQRKFKGVAAVCLKPAEKGAHFRELLLARARAFLDAKLDAADPAAVFFRNRSGDEADHPLIGEAFGEAAPELGGLSGRGQDEVMILSAPPGADGDRFRGLVAEALPGVELVPAAVADDIAFYREWPALPLSDLPHLGDAGRDAAAQMAAADHPPHARADVPWGQADSH
ncbi:MAG: protein kinase, partial [Gemmataceae bacterium]|nr:protein kinase [Gemmataceae bacterium]